MATDPNTLIPLNVDNTFADWMVRINEIIDATQTVNVLATDANVLDQNFALQYAGTQLNPLEIGIRGGYLRQDSDIVPLFPTTSPATDVHVFTLLPNATQYAYILCDEGFESLNVATVVPATSAIVLYAFVTGPSSITSVEEKRTFAIGRTAPPEGSGIPIQELQYATEGQTDFILASANASAGLAIYVDGARLTEGLDYTVFHDTLVKFPVGLPALTKVLFVSRDITGQVKIIGREELLAGTAGQTVINVPVNLQPTEPSISVYVSGVRQARTSLTYDDALNTITLPEPLSTDCDILLVKGDVAGVSDFQGIPPSGDEGDALVKFSSGNYDVSWTNLYNTNRIFNGACLVANGASGTVSNTAFNEHEVDNLFMKCNKPTGVTAQQSGTVAKTISRTTRAALTTINSGLVSYPVSVTHRSNVYAGEATALHSEAGVFSCKITQDSGANATATLRIYRVNPLTHPNDFTETSHAHVLISTAPIATIPTGTPTEVVFKLGNFGATQNGLVMEVEVSIASGTGTVNVHVSELDLRMGLLKRPFEPNFALDYMLADSMSRIGAVEQFFEDAAPRGYLVADGSEYLISKFPLLFKKYGHRFSNGVITPGYFRTPDARGLVLRGVDLGANRDPDALAKTFTATATNGSDYLQVNTSPSDMFNLSTYMIFDTTSLPPTVTLPAGTQIARIDFTAQRVYLTNTVTVAGAPATGTFTVVSRIMPDGSLVSDTGSVQQDSYRHNAILGGTGGGSNYPQMDTANANGSLIYTQTGGTETRMKNIAVLTCIKAK